VDQLYSAYTYVALNKPEDWTNAIDFTDPKAGLASIAEQFKGWAPQLTALITDGETDPMSNYVRAALDYHLSKLSLPPSFADNTELDSPMLITYKVATCEDGKRCRKGDHIIESLAARAYNLTLSATLLSAVGLYDEALNSVRSLGELANVLAYLSLYPDDYPNWVLANKKTRLSQYSPSAIRAAIEKFSAFPSVPTEKEAFRA
jgi:hypothetical protein